MDLYLLKIRSCFSGTTFVRPCVSVHAHGPPWLVLRGALALAGFVFAWVFPDAHRIECAPATRPPLVSMKRDGSEVLRPPKPPRAVHGRMMARRGWSCEAPGPFEAMVEYLLKTYRGYINVVQKFCQVFSLDMCFPRQRIWIGDIMVADIEELEKMDASELHARKLNAQEVLTPVKGKFIFPVADGTVKISREDQDLRTSHLNPGQSRQSRRTKVFEENQTGLLQPLIVV